MKIFALLLSCLFFIYSNLLASSPEALKKHMFSDLEFIRHSFEVKYAPMEWKKEFANWDLNEAFNQAKAKTNALIKPNVKDCQIILKEFFQTPQDYHVTISFLSTESATLPFVGMICEGHYYVVHVDRTRDNPPLKEGDEILTFNGVPILDALEKFRREDIGSNIDETDQSLAALMFTTRLGTLGHRIPQGEVVLSVLRKGAYVAEKVVLDWSYQEERIKAPEKKSFSLMNQIVTSKTPQKELIRSFFQKMMISPSYFNQKHPQADNLHWIGSKKSYIPHLGVPIWETSKDDYFDSYIFRITDPQLLPKGKKFLQVGYIRIPHYGGDEKEALAFQDLIAFMQYKTDALIIDQINNPGGSVFYLYALISMLTDTPLEAPKHRIALTQQEVALATLILDVLDFVPKGDDRMARELFGNTLGGYEINYHFVEACRNYCLHLINEWNKGHLFTAPTHLYGVDKIQPHSKDRYTKPLIAVINSLDFSGGDFLPAVLQDNKRATLLGTRTAGAGGYVNTQTYPNLLGVGFFHFTGSLAIRNNMDPLENLGVQPDVCYSLTKKDIENNYQGYRQIILESVCNLFR